MLVVGAVVDAKGAIQQLIHNINNILESKRRDEISDSQFVLR